MKRLSCPFFWLWSMLNWCLPALSVVKKIHYSITGSKDRCYMTEPTLARFRFVCPIVDVRRWYLLNLVCNTHHFSRFITDRLTECAVAKTEGSALPVRNPVIGYALSSISLSQRLISICFTLHIFRAVEHRLVLHGRSTVALYRIYHSISSEDIWIQISVSLAV